jgi:hypothetical protein
MNLNLLNKVIKGINENSTKEELIEAKLIFEKIKNKIENYHKVIYSFSKKLKVETNDSDIFIQLDFDRITKKLNREKPNNSLKNNNFFGRMKTLTEKEILIKIFSHLETLENNILLIKEKLKDSLIYQESPLILVEKEIPENKFNYVCDECNEFHCLCKPTKKINSEYYVEQYELDSIFSFGKYKGMSLKEVAKLTGEFIPKEKNKEIEEFYKGMKTRFNSGNSYIEWCINNIREFYIDIFTIKELKEINPEFNLSQDSKQSLKRKYEIIVNMES